MEFIEKLDCKSSERKRRHQAGRGQVVMLNGGHSFFGLELEKSPQASEKPQGGGINQTDTTAMVLGLRHFGLQP
ncbi:MAG TPA: hypothetical protein VL863_13265 [bacterium]|nr:hypothetical protein [bacterium]